MFLVLNLPLTSSPIPFYTFLRNVLHIFHAGYVDFHKLEWQKFSSNKVKLFGR